MSRAARKRLGSLLYLPSPIMSDCRYDFMMIEASEQEARALGVRTFRARPCRGDYVTAADADGTDQAYVVCAIIHPNEPDDEMHGELIVRRSGRDAVVRMALHAGRRPN